jgi:hypothetical protein
MKRQPTQIYKGYSEAELIEMYDEAKAMVQWCIMAVDQAAAKRWARIANDVSVSLHALKGGHTV